MEKTVALIMGPGKMEEELKRALGGIASVLSFRDGKEAIGFLIKNPAHLLVVDLELSGAGAWELVLQVPEVSFLKDLPIILLTEKKVSSLVSSGQWKVLNILYKPVDPPILATRARQFLEGKYDQLPGVDQAAK